MKIFSEIYFKFVTLYALLLAPSQRFFFFIKMLSTENIVFYSSAFIMQISWCVITPRRLLSQSIVNQTNLIYDYRYL